MTGLSATRNRGRAAVPYWRILVAAIATAILLVPIGAVAWLSLRPRIGSTLTGPTFDNFVHVFTTTDVLRWTANSLMVSLFSAVASVLVAAPAGYVLSRAKGRAVSAYSLLIFVIQSLPGVVFVIPLFVMFAAVQLVDTITGVAFVYVATSVSVACWMMTAYFDSIPVDLEEAAWLDGCSVFGAFVRIVLRNSFPGILSTAIYSFLLAWNDYLVALVFLRSASQFTLPIGIQTFFQQNQTDWGPVMACAVIMLVPPLLIFALLNRYFSVGGVGGALAGR